MLFWLLTKGNQRKHNTNGETAITFELLFNKKMRRVNILICVFLEVGICNAQYLKLLDFSGTPGKNPEGDLMLPGNGLYGRTDGLGSYNVYASGINEAENTATRNIFPNPAKNTITIKLVSAKLTMAQSIVCADAKQATLKINNSFGETVYSEVVNKKSNLFTKEINVAALRKGIYFVELLQGNSCSGHKFVLQ
jgi:hypothetical protein